MPCFGPRTSPCSPRSRSRWSRRRARRGRARRRPRRSSRRSGRPRAAPRRGRGGRGRDGGLPSTRRSARRGAPRRSAARIESAISAGGARADVEPGRDVDARSSSSAHAVGAQLGEHAGAALGWRPGRRRGRPPRGRAQRVQLVAPVRGDDEREVAGRRLSVARRRRRRRRGRARRRSRRPPGDRRLADDEHPRRGQHGLEEDLDRAAGEARVLRRSRRRPRWRSRRPSGPSPRRSGRIRSSTASPVCERLQRSRRARCARRRRRRRSPRSSRRRARARRRPPRRWSALGAHDRRRHERLALARRAPALAATWRRVIIAVARAAPASPPRRAPGCRACRCGRRRGSRAARR